MAKSLRKQFGGQLPSASGSDRSLRATIAFIQRSIGTAAELLDCLSEGCSYLESRAARLSNAERQRLLVVAYNLFARAIALADAQNQLVELILAMAGRGARSDAVRPEYARCWQQLSENDRLQLEHSARRKAAKMRDEKSLVSPLIDALTRTLQRAPTLDELFDFDPAPDTPHKGFDERLVACGKAWDAFNFRAPRQSKPTESALKLMDAAFQGFREYLAASATDPLVFFQVLKWIRERAGVRPTRMVGKQKFLSLSWSPFWSELYLEAVFQGFRLAVTKWNYLRVMKAKGLPREDEGFFAHLSTPDEVAKLVARIAFSFKDVKAFHELNRMRRRLHRFAAYHRVSLLDELEIVELQNRIAREQATNAAEVKQRYVRVASLRDAFRDRYRIDQSVMDHFTIVWIEPEAREPAIVEFHGLDCALFRTDAAGLERLVDTAFYKELARNAQNLTVFMLAYLELLGLLVDVVTAARARGLRNIAVEFIKERMKDAATERVLDAFHVDNPALRIVAGMAANSVRLPRSGRGSLADAGLDAKGVRNRGTSGTSGDEPQLGQLADARVANVADARAQHEPAAWTDAQRAQMKQQGISAIEDQRAKKNRLLATRQEEQLQVVEAQGELRMAAGTKRPVTQQQVGRVQVDRRTSGAGVDQRGTRTDTPPERPKSRELPLSNSVGELPHTQRAFRRYPAEHVRDLYVNNINAYPAHIRDLIAGLPTTGTRGLATKLEAIDIAIRRVHTNEANRIYQLNGRRKGTPFVMTSRATSNEGGQFASLVTDGKNFSLHGQLKGGGVVELDSVSLRVGEAVEVKMNLHRKTDQEILDQMRRQAQFAEDWGLHVKWEVYADDVVRVERAWKVLADEMYAGLAARILIQRL